MTAEESALPDEELARRAQRADRGAFDTLVRRHKSALYRLIRRYVGDADDAYDVLQNAWISVWEALPRYDAERPFLAWVRVIALNKCRDFSRRQRVRRLVLQLFVSEPTTAPAPAEQHEAQATALREEERLQRLEKAIAALPAFYKEPLVLTTAGGLTQEAAAAVLKTTTKAVEMRLRRARRKLADTLGTA